MVKLVKLRFKNVGTRTDWSDAAVKEIARPYPTYGVLAGSAGVYDGAFTGWPLYIL